MFRILRHGNNSIEGNYVCGALMVRVDMRNITGVTLVRHPGWSTLILLICSVWLTGLGLYFMFFRPALLPEDLRYMGNRVVRTWSGCPDEALKKLRKRIQQRDRKPDEFAHAA